MPRRKYAKRESSDPIRVRWLRGGVKNHPGRANRQPRYKLSSSGTVVGPNDFWECTSCNKRYPKELPAHVDKPKEWPPYPCGNTYWRAVEVPNDRGNPNYVLRQFTCEGDTFRDDVDIRFFREKAEGNPELYAVEEVD